MPQSAASWAGASPIGLSAVASSGRPLTPVSSRSPAIPARGPGSQSKATSGSSTSARNDVRLQRAVAEQDVEELRRIAGGGGEGVGDGDAVEILARGADLHHAAEDVVGYLGIARRDVAGELDRLLEQQCLGTRGHVPGGGADEIRDVEAGVAGFAPHG